MDPVLQTFESTDSSFSQFVNNYGVANMDPETRWAYRRGQLAAMFHYMELQEEREEARAEGEAEGEARGRTEGEAEGEARGIRATAKNLLKLGIPTDQIITATGLTRVEIDSLSE